MLDAKGYEVISANNGQDGFQKATTETPDLIILDVMMTSNTEGFDIARNLQSSEITRNIPIIMITGIKKAMNLSFSFEPDEDWLPVKDYLEKPVKPRKLLETVEKYL